MKKVFLLLFVSVLLSAYYVHNDDAKIYDFTLQMKEKTVHLQTLQDIQNYASQALNLEKSTLVTSVSLDAATDSQGDYYLVRGKYTIEGKATNFAIPLEITENPNKLSEGGCVMKCEVTTPNYSGVTRQIVYERCKKQHCSCDEPGLCRSTVIFENEKE